MAVRAFSAILLLALVAAAGCREYDKVFHPDWESGHGYNNPYAQEWAKNHAPR